MTSHEYQHTLPNGVVITTKIEVPDDTNVDIDDMSVYLEPGGNYWDVRLPLQRFTTGLSKALQERVGSSLHFIDPVLMKYGDVKGDVYFEIKPLDE